MEFNGITAAPARSTWTRLSEIPAAHHARARALTHESAIAFEARAANTRRQFELMSAHLTYLKGLIAETKENIAASRALTAQVEKRMEEQKTTAADARLDIAAKALQAENPDLSIEQAVAKALDADPSLYIDPCQQSRKAAAAPTVARNLSENETQLMALAANIRQADPKLTAEQSVAKALEQRPDLYEG